MAAIGSRPILPAAASLTDIGTRAAFLYSVTLDPMSETTDPSNGYESSATRFLSRRDATVGAATVASWADGLVAGNRLLDLGCGAGGSYTPCLLDRGLQLFAIDASPRLLKAYQQRYPSVTTACEPAEASSFFNRDFHGVIAIGLIFLLQPATQLSVLSKMAKSLTAGGRLLFSSPYQICAWNDLLTGRQSRSLGRSEYQSALKDQGLSLVAEYTDEGGSHYFAFES